MEYERMEYERMEYERMEYEIMVKTDGIWKDVYNGRNMEGWL